ncbi:MAG: hypothetical protein V4557_12760 [Bacteroidota bacterium]
MNFLKGETVIILNTECQPAGEAIVNYYSVGTKTYSVFYQYLFAEESEEISLPEWMLRKKNTEENCGSQKKRDRYGRLAKI